MSSRKADLVDCSLNVHNFGGVKGFTLSKAQKSVLEIGGYAGVQCMIFHCAKFYWLTSCDVIDVPPIWHVRTRCPINVIPFYPSSPSVMSWLLSAPDAPSQQLIHEYPVSSDLGVASTAAFAMDVSYFCTQPGTIKGLI